MSITRRDFLAGLAAVGGASLLRPVSAHAQERDPGDAWYSQPRRFTYSRPIIDAHYHWYPPEFIDLMVKEGAANGAVISGPNEEGSYTAKVPGADFYSANGSTFRREMRDFDIMFKQMDDRDVNMYVLTMTHPHLNWAPPEFGLKLAQTYNNALGLSI